MNKKNLPVKIKMVGLIQKLAVEIQSLPLVANQGGVDPAKAGEEDPKRLFETKKPPRAKKRWWG